MSKLWAARDRPLFSSSRRPPPPRVVAVPPPPPATAEPVAPAAPPFTLVGTIIGGDNRIGIFFNETSKITTRICRGDVDSGWTLRSIDARSAVLDGDGRMVTLDLPEPSVPADPGPRVSGLSMLPATMAAASEPRNLARPDMPRSTGRRQSRGSRSKRDRRPRPNGPRRWKRLDRVVATGGSYPERSFVFWNHCYAVSTTEAFVTSFSVYCRRLALLAATT